MQNNSLLLEASRDSWRDTAYDWEDKWVNLNHTFEQLLNPWMINYNDTTTNPAGENKWFFNATSLIIGLIIGALIVFFIMAKYIAGAKTLLSHQTGGRGKTEDWSPTWKGTEDERPDIEKEIIKEPPKTEPPKKRMTKSEAKKSWWDSPEGKRQKEIQRKKMEEINRKKREAKKRGQ
jgi:hypothetical protein